MITELWEYLTTPASKEARDEGHLYNSIALAQRARRCRGSWRPHLQQCHALVADAIVEFQPKTVAILGSGLLLETPPELFDQESKVDFVDVVHNKDVRSKKLSPRFRLMEYNLNDKFPKDQYDLIISANLLSQLPLTRPADEAARLQLRHWNWLKNCGSKVLLYSDYQIQFLDDRGQLMESESTVSESLNIEWHKEWLWDVAPIPEYQSDTALRFKMGAVLI